MTRITNKTILLFFLLLHDLPPYLKASFEKVSTSASYQVVLPSLLLLWSWCIVSPPSYSCVTYRLQILPRLLSFWTSSLYVCILLRLFSHGPRAPPNIKVRKAYWHPNGTWRPHFGHLIFSWSSSCSSGGIRYVPTLMLLLLLGLRSLFLQTLLDVSDDVSCCFSTSSSRCWIVTAMILFFSHYTLQTDVVFWP